MNNEKKTLIVIPARYNSSRFPGKPLIKINGIPMIKRTYDQAYKNTHTNDILIATDSSKIETFCKDNNMNVVMTSKDCQSGTDRVAEVSKMMPEFDCYFNLQGDEPVINPKYIDQCIESFFRFYPKYELITAYAKLPKERAILPETVKVVFNEKNEAIRFSRSLIPESSFEYHNHIGIYCFSSKILNFFSNHPRTDNELFEKIEMIRILDLGIKIKMIEIEETFAVDIPSDVKKVEKFINKKTI